MSEPLRLQPATIVDAPALARSAQPIGRPDVHNDNHPDQQSGARVGERIAFEIPAWIWRTMVACYSVFLTLLLAATGGGRASFAIAISAVYIAMFFGTAKVMLGQAPAQPASPLLRSSGKLATIYGPLATYEVVAQMLVVPAAVVFFGAAVFVIRLAVF